MTNKKFDINQKIDWCFAVLGARGTWVYNYPMLGHYGVCNDELNYFEIESRGMTNFILTIGDNSFDSVKYDNNVRGRLNNLWNATRQKCEKNK